MDHIISAVGVRSELDREFPSSIPDTEFCNCLRSSLVERFDHGWLPHLAYAILENHGSKGDPSIRNTHC